MSNRYFTAGTIKHTNSFDDNFRNEFNRTFLDEDLELEEAKLRAVKHSAVKEDLRKRDLTKLSNLLDTGQTEFMDWTCPEGFGSHLKMYESDFEKSIKDVLNSSRQTILNYTATIVNSIINTNTTKPVAFKLLKRLAIRLGFQQYTVHI